MTLSHHVRGNQEPLLFMFGDGSIVAVRPIEGDGATFIVDMPAGVKLLPPATSLGLKIQRRRSQILRLEHPDGSIVRLTPVNPGGARLAIEAPDEVKIRRDEKGPPETKPATAPPQGSPDDAR